MMTDAERRKAAASLLLAERERKPVVQFSKTWPEITIIKYSDFAPAPASGVSK